MRVTQMLLLSQGRRNAWIKMTSQGEIGKGLCFNFLSMQKFLRLRGL